MAVTEIAQYRHMLLHDRLSSMLRMVPLTLVMPNCHPQASSESVVDYLDKAEVRICQ
jgi:hypothetical protein